MQQAHGADKPCSEGARAPRIGIVDAARGLPLAPGLPGAAQRARICTSLLLAHPLVLVYEPHLLQGGGRRRGLLPRVDDLNDVAVGLALQQRAGAVGADLGRVGRRCAGFTSSPLRPSLPLPPLPPLPPPLPRCAPVDAAAAAWRMSAATRTCARYRPFDKQPI